jgi:hypothetical protein
MLAYDDVDHDTHLNLNEFYAAFSKLYSKPLFSLCCFLFLFTAILMLLFYTFHSTYLQKIEPFILGNTVHAYI